MADQEALALEIAEEILWPWFQEQIQPYALRRDLFGMLKCGEQQWFGLPEAITRYLAARDKAQAERDEKVGEILRWLYGLAPEGFAPRRPDAGAYWWRTEMSQRLEAAGMGDLLAPEEGGRR